MCGVSSVLMNLGMGRAGESEKVPVVAIATAVGGGVVPGGILGMLSAGEMLVEHAHRTGPQKRIVRKVLCISSLQITESLHKK
jgi:hypothetical protein